MNKVKLLIVDDEQVERDGLQAILRNNFQHLAIEQARNGKDAIEIAREFVPDLVLMDIKMPGMNGLEAVEHLAAEHPRMKFVMVTAYDTFEFARSSLKLGVKDYLLKPSKASEITATVGKVLKEIEEERIAMEQQKLERETLKRVMPVVEADVVTQLLFDHVHEVHLDEMLGWLGGNTTRLAYAMLIVIHASPFSESFYAGVKEKVRQMENGWVGAMSGRHIPLIVFEERGISFRSQASRMTRQLLSLQRQVQGTDCFIGIGNPYGSLEDIRLSYQEALLCSVDSSVPSRHRFFCDIPSSEESENAFRSIQREKQFIELIRTGKWEEVKTALTELVDMYYKSSATLVRAAQRVLEELWMMSRVLMEMGVEFEKPFFSFPIQDYRQLRTETACWVNRLSNAAQIHQSAFEGDVVLQIKQYIESHSREDISLETIAARFGWSPYYISKTFKEQLGVNYIDYLTQCRLEKAKALMADPLLSLKEITYEVGYHDPNYFSKVFKKMNGVSPTDYRKAILRKKV